MKSPMTYRSRRMAPRATREQQLVRNGRDESPDDLVKVLDINKAHFSGTLSESPVEQGNHHRLKMGHLQQRIKKEIDQRLADV